MITTFTSNWKIYCYEALALGLFMVSACGFAVIIEHPDFWIKQNIESSIFRRFLMGCAMGITAVLLIYSNFGKASGAHMNPAVTIANWQMDRMKTWDAIFYIIFQFIGGILGVLLFKIFFYEYISNPDINYVVTVPSTDASSVLIPFLSEFLISFIMLLSVLILSNIPKLANYTGYFVGILLVVYITFEAPISGMSLNPARTLASAFSSGNYSNLWLYFAAPIFGMLLASVLFRKSYKVINCECQTMNCFMSGKKHGNKIYEVLKYYFN
jgi:aquaporin Z